jgi:hypothetical protein
MVLENQQSGVKNVAFLTPDWIFFTTFAPDSNKKEK